MNRCWGVPSKETLGWTVDRGSVNLQHSLEQEKWGSDRASVPFLGWLQREPNTETAHMSNQKETPLTLGQRVMFKTTKRKI